MLVVVRIARTRERRHFGNQRLFNCSQPQRYQRLKHRQRQRCRDASVVPTERLAAPRLSHTGSSQWNLDRGRLIISSPAVIKVRVTRCQSAMAESSRGFIR